MSVWTEEPDSIRPGVVYYVSRSLALELLVPLGLMVGLLMMIGGGTPLLIIGFALLLLAKSSILKRGIYTSWGSRLMTPGFRLSYRAGYALMILGAVPRVFGLFAHR